MRCPPPRRLQPSTDGHTCLQNPMIPNLCNPDLSRQIHRHLSQSASCLWVILGVEDASTDWADASLSGCESHREGNVPRWRRPLPAGRRERRQVLDLSLYAKRPRPRNGPRALSHYLTFGGTLPGSRVPPPAARRDRPDRSQKG